MKILYITNGFPPLRWAGTETYTASIAKEITNLGASVQVLCCGDWQNGDIYCCGYDDDVYNGLPVRRIHLNWIKAPDPSKYLYNDPVIRKFLSQYLEEIQPDLVHVTSCETLSASVLVAVKEKRIPLVLSITDFWFLCPRINLLHSNGDNCDGITTPWDCLRCRLYGTKAYRWPRTFLPERAVEIFLTQISKYPFFTRRRGLRGMAGDMADRKKFLRHVFTLPNVRLTASEFVRNIHQAAGFDDPVQIHTYGHELSWLKHYQGKADSKKIRLGFVGQITPSKGVHILLTAVKHLDPDTQEKIQVLIYGNLQKNPAYSERLQTLSKGLNNIEFCGTYPREKSAEIYSKFDVLVVPSLWYDFPLVIYEAFATGTPVIATNLGGMAESVSDGVNGLLFERGNVIDLKSKIERLVREPNLLQSLTKGISKVKTIEQEGTELLELYKNLIEHNEEIHL